MCLSGPWAVRERSVSTEKNKTSVIFQDPVTKLEAHETIKSMGLIAVSLAIDKVNSISGQSLIF